MEEKIDFNKIEKTLKNVLISTLKIENSANEVFARKEIFLKEMDMAISQEVNKVVTEMIDEIKSIRSATEDDLQKIMGVLSLELEGLDL